MKLAAIYNVFDGEELLGGSIACLKSNVDLIIIIYQDVSNFGEAYNPLPEIKRVTKDLPNVILKKYFPPSFSGFQNESAKRNYGLTVAKENNCTHFLHLDCDEYYEDFFDAKMKYIESCADGSVVSILTYFKKPTLRLENPDNYYVPFIHKLEEKSLAGWPEYPYYVDPTRKINCQKVVHLPVFMHHFSYVRRDIELKCRNSSAKKNIERSDLIKNYHDPAVGPGYFLKDYNQKLIEVENLFSIQY